MSIFSERLAELMEQQKINDTKLAEDLSVSRTTVLRWRTGERSPKLPKLKEIANYFNVSPKEFVEDELLDSERSLSQRQAVPVYGSVRAGNGGLALQEFQGFEYFEDIKNPEDYFVLKVDGDSMSGDGIFQDDYVLIKKTPTLEFDGQIAVVLIDGMEGTLKRVYCTKNSLTLQASNRNYQPRTFVGEEMKEIQIVGVLKELKRKF